LQIVRTGELDEAIAQILPLQKDENHEYRHDAGRGQRPQQRRDQRRNAFKRGGRGLTHLDRDRLDFLSGRYSLRRRDQGRRGVLWLVKLLPEVLQNVGGAFQRAAGGGRPAHRFDLFTL
jgi:hypothetical protein